MILSQANIAHVAPVSVVIPCYRCASTIGRAVNSVLAQNLLPAEVILVEDDSKDGTLQVLQELERIHHGWIKIIKMSANLGAGSARNAGWSLATQPYIAFLDADDTWHTDKLYIQFDYMKKNGEVALCGHRCIEHPGRETPVILTQEIVATRLKARSLLFRNPFSTPTVMVKRNISFRFHEGRRFSEDIKLWQQIAFADLAVVRIESALAYVHKPFYGAGGLSAKLWEMEKSELINFRDLWHAGSINFGLYAAATIVSVIKYVKRLIVVTFLMK